MKLQRTITAVVQIPADIGNASHQVIAAAIARCIALEVEQYLANATERSVTVTTSVTQTLGDDGA
jgi:hypothetical protein